MSTGPLYSFAARMESLGAMVDHLRAVATQWESTSVLRAESALEELLTNSVVHGAAISMPASEIWLSVALQADRLVLRYEDAFAAFDPMAKIDAALRRTANPMDQWPPGGLGLLMVFRMADEFRYRHQNGRNCIELSFIRRPG